MAGDSQSEVTGVLDQIRAGHADGKNQLVQMVYDELRRMAKGLLHRERSGHTWTPTDLVHEALPQLLQQELLEKVPDRRSVLAAAFRVMQHLLIDHARRRAAGKHGGGLRQVPLEDTPVPAPEVGVDVLALREALDQLAALSTRQSEVAMLRYFWGFTVAEVAVQLDISVSTVESDSRKALAFLRTQLAEGEADDTRTP